MVQFTYYGARRVSNWWDKVTDVDLPWGNPHKGTGFYWKAKNTRALSKQGLSDPEWARLYPFLSNIPLLGSIYRGMNDEFEHNKMVALYGTDVQDPANTRLPSAYGQMLQGATSLPRQVLFTRNLESIYGSVAGLDHHRRGQKRLTDWI